MKINRVALAAAFFISGSALTVTLAGCSTSVPVEPAASANDPLCAEVSVRLPESIGKLKKRATTAQATGAWGDPAAVILRCGTPESQPTTDPCISVDGVDWVIDKSTAPRYRFEAYGRSPGLEVFVDSELASGTDALLELSAAVKRLPQPRQCSAHSDSLDSNQIESQ